MVDAIAANLAWARDCMDTTHLHQDYKAQAKMFGIGFQLRLTHFRIRPIWPPEHMAPLHGIIDQVQRLADQGRHRQLLETPICHFGHLTPFFI